MKEKSNIGVMVIIIVIILLGLVGVYLVKNDKLDLKKDDNNTTTNFDEVEEKEFLNANLKKMNHSLGLITILTSIDKYNAGGNYVTKKNDNLLKDNTKRQLFVMEQIVSNEDNYKNFVILNMEGKVDNKESIPTMDGVTAYYPYDLFKEEYKKYFKESFNVEERKVSGLNNTYDKDKNYIYYENRRAGSNGLSVTGITVNSISTVEKGKYRANVTLNYSERLAELLGVKSEQGELIYYKENNNIQIDSYLLK